MEKQKKIKVGVFFGGVSPEHEVSIMSSAGILEALDQNKFEVIEYYITKSGELLSSKQTLTDVQSNNHHALQLVKLSELAQHIDIAFPVLHGAGGEDGSIQGFFETLKIPYVGNHIASSVVCLDKAIFNKLCDTQQIARARYAILDHEYQTIIEQQDVIKNVRLFTLPLFVKPARTGSSIGVTKVNQFESLQDAIIYAKQFDQKIIIEEAVINCSEIEVAVLGNDSDTIEISLPGKIIPGAEFYDYNDKYTNGKATFEIPAKIPAEQINLIQTLAKQAYKMAGCKGLARVDFLVNNSGAYLNEINTLPGFTQISMYPKLWKASGLSYKDLLTKLILLAIT